MTVTQIFPGVHNLSLGAVNCLLIEDGEQLTVIDTGYAKSEAAILAAAQGLGRPPSAITQIVLTHCHPDHAGSAAALQRRTGAQLWAHHADAEVVRGHVPMVRSQPSPGLSYKILYWLFIKNVSPEIETTEIHNEISDAQVLPISGGLRAIHTPGHSAGHLAFVLERDGGLLIAGDACSNMASLDYSIVYDDFAAGQRSLAKLTAVPCQTICFGHGKPLSGPAVERFRRRWGA
jgi:glyoxylase-like metal-dependent hydrolase (beta-lactamase superfamily II)